MSRSKREEFQDAALSYRMQLFEELRNLPQSMDGVEVLDLRVNLLNRLDNQSGFMYSSPSALIDSGSGDRGAANGQDLDTAKSSDS